MSKTTGSIVIIVIVLLIIAGFLFDWFRSPVIETQNKIVVDANDMIRVNSPLASSTISSPVNIAGEARGGWYFEGSFPIVLLDDSGSIISTGIAEAQGEWMTQDYVPFVATMTFSKVGSTTGTIVLKKDNPSDRREFDAEVRVPVYFK